MMHTATDKTLASETQFGYIALLVRKGNYPSWTVTGGDWGRSSSASLMSSIAGVVNV